ncbi:hypothetical protein AVEN_241056-1 [Araneus ventricosus]|uniref:Uncharacterized protein n=1 Tax=Araneus ventricosus TaxID=182803 RepID=A0A4Y2LCG6_ARAVE|nr:hypothetical protein AVEN_241056-1 [Araneus ventricosus]
MDRLMSLAYAECPLDVLERLVAQYFVDVIRDEDAQYSSRLIQAKYPKAVLAYNMKYEAAKNYPKTSRHVRSIEIKDDTGNERDDKFYSLLKRLEKLLNSSVIGTKNVPRRNWNVVYWMYFKKGLVQRECQANYVHPGKLTCGRLAERRIPSLNKAPIEGLKTSALSGGKNGLYLEGLICGILCLMLLDTGTSATVLTAALVLKLKEQLQTSLARLLLVKKQRYTEN